MFRDDEPPRRSTIRSLAPAAGLLVALLSIAGMLAVVQPSIHRTARFVMPDTGAREFPATPTAVGRGSVSSLAVTPTVAAPGTAVAPTPSQTTRTGPAASLQSRADPAAADSGTTTLASTGVTPEVEPHAQPTAADPSVPPTRPAPTRTPRPQPTPGAPTATPPPVVDVPTVAPTVVPPEPTATPNLVEAVVDLLDLGE